MIKIVIVAMTAHVTISPDTALLVVKKDSMVQTVKESATVRMRVFAINIVALVNVRMDLLGSFAVKFVIARAIKCVIRYQVIAQMDVIMATLDHIAKVHANVKMDIVMRQMGLATVI